MKCEYCGNTKKKLSRIEVANGDRLPICKGCCRTYFKMDFRQLEKYNRNVRTGANAELLGFIVIKATLWANKLFGNEKKAERWMTSVNARFLGESPLQIILRGEPSQVINFLEQRLGRKPSAAF